MAKRAIASYDGALVSIPSAIQIFLCELGRKAYALVSLDFIG